MALSRKHYEEIADILNANMAEEGLVLDFVTYLADDNEHFRGDLFIAKATAGIRLQAEATPGRLDRYIARHAPKEKK